MVKYTTFPDYSITDITMPVEATADFSPPTEEIRVVIDRTVGGRPRRTILMGGMKCQVTGGSSITLECMRPSALDEDADEIVILSEKQTAKLFKWLEKRGLGAYNHDE